jgi:hypothetical protein
LGNDLELDKTLEENNIPDEEEEFERVGIEPDYYYPAIHLVYNDKKHLQKINGSDV